MRLPWRQPAPCPSTWACVAETTPPRPVVWLGEASELQRTARIAPLPGDTEPWDRDLTGRSCHGDGWCNHCGRQLPGLGVATPVDAVGELRGLLARVAAMEPR